MTSQCRDGLTQHYASALDFNHPPPIAWVAARLWEWTRDSRLTFAGAFRTMVALANLGSAALLWVALRGHRRRALCVGAYCLAPVALALAGIEGGGPRLAALALILAVTGLLTAYATALLLGYDKGTAAGLLGGSLTQSAILGSAGDAIARLDRGPVEKRLLSDNISVAYAVTYLFGTAGRRLVPVPGRPTPAGR